MSRSSPTSRVAEPNGAKPCPGCGLLLSDDRTGAFARMDASPACWALFGELLARAFAEPAYYSDVHFLTVATCAVQHAPAPSPGAAEPLALQLIALQLATEGDASLEEIKQTIVRLTHAPPTRLRRLPPPRPRSGRRSSTPTPC